MSEREPTVFNLSAAQLSLLAKRATREAVRSNLRAGIPVTGMVEGRIRTIYPTDPLALALICDDREGVRISGFLDIKFDIVDTVFGTAVSELLSPS